MGISTKDRQYMRLALELAEKGRGRTSPNPMVGAVIVRDDEIIGQGYHRRAGEPHAEVEAIADAGGDKAVRDATVYVTLEPCSHQGRTPPCADRLIEAGIARVVAAIPDPNPLVAGRGLRRLRSAGIEVDCGVYEGEARRLNEAFITFHLLNRPFIIAKWAMSLDGRTSTDLGDSKWISNEESRAYSHEIRASVDAIAVGVGTILHDNPRLDVRLPRYKERQPACVIFDGRLRTPTKARCLEKHRGAEAILVTTEFATNERIDRMREAGHTVLVVPGKNRMIDIAEALPMLAHLGIQSMLVEGGREIHTSLLRAGLADKIVAFMGPRIIGGESLMTPLVDLGIQKMRSAIQLKNVTVKSFGTDACVEGYINSPPKLPVPFDF